MSIPRAALFFSTLSVAASASSCGSLISRTVVLRTQNPQPLFFMGVFYDYLFVTDRMGHGEGNPWYLRGAAGVDLPLSLAMDVVLLPIDAAVWMIWTPGAQGR